MTTPAALLYGPEAPWQSPAVAKKPGGNGKKNTTPKPVHVPPAQADDAPPVAVPKAEDIENHPAVKLGKAWYALAVVQTLVLGTAIGGYYKLDSKIDKQDAKIAQQADRLEALVKWLKDPKSFPGTKGVNLPTDEQADAQLLPQPAPPQPAPTQGPTPDGVGDTATPTPVVSVKPGPKSLPSTITPRNPPDCVSKVTHAKFACERATNCVGLEGYDPKFYRDVRLKAKAGEWMMICDEKAP